VETCLPAWLPRTARNPASSPLLGPAVRRALVYRSVPSRSNSSSSNNNNSNSSPSSGLWGAIRRDRIHWPQRWPLTKRRRRRLGYRHHHRIRPPWRFACSWPGRPLGTREVPLLCPRTCNNNISITSTMPRGRVNRGEGGRPPLPILSSPSNSSLPSPGCCRRQWHRRLQPNQARRMTRTASGRRCCEGTLTPETRTTGRPGKRSPVGLPIGKQHSFSLIQRPLRHGCRDSSMSPPSRITLVELWGVDCFCIRIASL